MDDSFKYGLYLCIIMEIKTKLKKWGNSLGIIVPREILIERGLKEGQDILVDISKEGDLSDIFGSLKDWKIDPQKIKDEIREEEFESEEIFFRHLRNDRTN